MLMVDAGDLIGAESSPVELCDRLARGLPTWADAGIYLRRVEAFLDPEGRPHPEGVWAWFEAWIASPRRSSWAARPIATYARFSTGLASRPSGLPTPLCDMRRRLGSAGPGEAFAGCNGADLEALANRFALTGGQIRNAVRSAQ